jgi:hypothetical protein
MMQNLETVLHNVVKKRLIRKVKSIDLEVLENTVVQPVKTVVQRKPRGKKVKKEEVLLDDFSEEILKEYYSIYKDSYCRHIKINEKVRCNLRAPNPQEHLSENIVKFIIRNYEGDKSCMWAKAINKQGDLYSAKYSGNRQIEVKSFTSDGPCSFGPKKKFGVIYFLDMREWLNDKFTLWKVNLTDESPAWKGLKMSKTQTHEDQCDQNRRPHIGWDNLKIQLDQSVYTKVYEGPFENIFIEQVKEQVDPQ